MSDRHVVVRAADAVFEPSPDGRGGTRWMIAGEGSPGALHTEFSVCALEPGDRVATAVQSYEECFYVLDGNPVLQTPEGATRLVPGDYGLLPVGVAHAWRNEGGPARFAQMRATQPRAAYGHDVFTVPDLPETEPVPVDVRDPRTRAFGHIEPINMEVDKQRQELLALSASMRTALLVYSGITVKMMVDSDLGADLTTMFMVQYEPAGVAGPHDHPFEETYLFLEGEAEAVFDGQTYLLGPGDAAFAGVGCVHGFRNVGAGPVRWLETQAPQPPGRHSYRFVRDWDYLNSVKGS
ncbi:Cupin domain-containing protein [Asanoa hainanensis]|uniref:Cupin domain-containing protein n=1 Tax=Asanoa hainanensis TaxID=560556 RepID=A0A239P9E4_9ACTN|nr:cupin domain-containing protein [Asanoa hainanensis]SNT63334.1 Cupin domain-containing protein [Asanoa hainanensis]